MQNMLNVIPYHNFETTMFQGKGRRGREREEEGKELRVREGAKGKGRIEEEMR